MIKKTLTLLLFLFSPLVAFASDASYSSNQEVIDKFGSDIRVNQDASIDITETIVYNFGTNQKHGPFRDIPFKYSNKVLNYNLRISDISVKDENFNDYKFETSINGKNLHISIGDANLYVTGSKTYMISYKVKRAVSYYADFDEIYWNVTGNEWQIPILKASASVILPSPLQEAEIKHSCYSGVLNSTKACDNTDLLGVNGKIYRIDFDQINRIGNGQGLTIAVGFSKGVVKAPSFVDILRDILVDNLFFSFPVLVFIILFYIWFTRGRDPEGRKTIVPQYDPPDNLTPAEVGAIWDETVNNKDISANIINLAVRGYIKIKKTEKGIILKSDDYILQRLKRAQEKNLEGFDQKLIDSLFFTDDTVKLSALKDKFNKELESVKDSLYQDITLKGYFPKNPNNIRKKYVGVGVFFLIVPFFAAEFIGMAATSSIFITGLMIFLFSFIMPSKTKQGVLAKEYIIGFKEYLSMVEKERIKFFNAPEKNPQTFEKLLPYAMVLGVEKEWAEQFKGMYNQNPSWYEDSSGVAFNPVLFTTNLNSFSSYAGNTLSSTPSSSGSGGGGFSGGGFGGGGGSW